MFSCQTLNLIHWSVWLFLECVVQIQSGNKSFARKHYSLSGKRGLCIMINIVSMLDYLKGKGDHSKKHCKHEQNSNMSSYLSSSYVLLPKNNKLIPHMSPVQVTKLCQGPHQVDKIWSKDISSSKIPFQDYSRQL